METDTTMFNLKWSNETFSSGHSVLGTLTEIISLWKAGTEIPSVWIGNNNKMDVTFSGHALYNSVTIRNPTTNETWEMSYRHYPAEPKQKNYKFPLP